MLNSGLISPPKGESKNRHFEKSLAETIEEDLIYFGELLPENPEVVFQMNTPRILLIDDDPSYCQLMERLAKLHGIPLRAESRLDQLPPLNQLKFDVALIDFDLGETNGCELTEYLETILTQEKPIIIVSYADRSGDQSWPRSIREFVHKGDGPLAAIDAALAVYENAMCDPG